MATATVTVEGYDIRATYEGGAYIDLHFGESDIAFDVINVYDYRAGAPTIPNTDEAVAAELAEWIEAAGDSLRHDLDNYALNA